MRVVGRGLVIRRRNDPARGDQAISKAHQVGITGKSAPITEIQRIGSVSWMLQPCRKPTFFLDEEPLAFELRLGVTEAEQELSRHGD